MATLAARLCCFRALIIPRLARQGKHLHEGLVRVGGSPVGQCSLWNSALGQGLVIYFGRHNPTHRPGPFRRWLVSCYNARQLVLCGGSSALVSDQPQSTLAVGRRLLKPGKDLCPTALAPGTPGDGIQVAGEQTKGMTDSRGTPETRDRRRTGLRMALVLIGFFFLLAATVLVAGGQPDPAAQDAAAAVTATERPSSTPTASPTPTPTVPTATPSRTPTQTMLRPPGRRLPRQPPRRRPPRRQPARPAPPQPWNPRPRPYPPRCSPRT